MATFKQKTLRTLYPVIRKLGRSGKNGTVLSNEAKISPQKSFYELEITLNNGKNVNFSLFSGKKVLLVNTASDCGYSGQYTELQSLYEKLKDRLIIIAFPANDFAGQEKGSDKQIAEYCQVNYGVTFLVARKGGVVKNEHQQPTFKWLTDSNENGWNDHTPDWNFSKYIVDEQGMLTHYFGPSISPMEDQFLKAVE